MNTLSEEMLDLLSRHAVTVHFLEKYGDAANDGRIPKTEWVKESLPPFLRQELNQDELQ